MKVTNRLTAKLAETENDFRKIQNIYVPGLQISPQ